MASRGQEKDDEIKGEGNSLNYTFRMHDPRVGRWFAKDPLEKKYPNLSTYAYCANSPIIFIDIDGRDLYLGGQVATATEDIYSLVNDKYKSAITISKEGKVSLNIDNISPKDLKNDLGLLLISQLVNSKNKFLYEVKETGNDNLPLASCNSTITNLSVELRMEFSRNSDKVKDGYQGQVIIHQDLVSETVSKETDQDGKTTTNTYVEPRGSTVFHELAENYERTENKLKYIYGKTDKKGNTVEDTKKKGAHQVAIDRAKNLTSKYKKTVGSEGSSTNMYIKSKK